MNTKKSPFILLIFLFISIFETSIAETNRMTISQLILKSDDVWVETFHDEGNNTITIDVPITIPKVDHLPVVKVKRHRQLDDSIYDEYTEEGVYIPPRKLDDLSTLNLQYHDDFDISPKWNNNKLTVIRNYYYPLDTHVPNETNIDWDLHANGNQYSFQEAYSFLKRTFKENFSKYGIPDEEVDMSLQYANTIDIIYKGNHVVDHDGYEFRCVQNLHGIPIVGNADAPYMWQNNAYLHESIYSNYIIMNFSSETSYSFGSVLWEEINTLHDDIKVISFEEIKPKLISLIQEGHICEIYKIELAYLAYFDENRNAKKGMVLVPTWVIHCQYRFKTKDYSEFVPSDTIYGSGGYQILAFNAQTGEYYDPMSKEKDRSDCPKIIKD